MPQRAQLRAVLEEEMATIGRRSYAFLAELLRSPSSQYITRDSTTYRIERTAREVSREGISGLLITVTVTRMGGLRSLLPERDDVFVAKPSG